MEDFSEYNQNFSLELIGKDDEINLHLNTLFLELQDIYTATYIFRWGCVFVLLQVTVP